MHDTLATRITSFLDIRALVAARRNRSILLVNGCLFFDVYVTLRDVCLGLIIIVVAHKISNGIFRKEALEFAVELGGKGLVVGHNQRGLIQRGDDVCHGKRLSGAGYPQQGLVLRVISITLNQLLYCAGLVALWGEW